MRANISISLNEHLTPVCAVLRVIYTRITGKQSRVEESIIVFEVLLYARSL